MKNNFLLKAILFIICGLVIFIAGILCGINLQKSYYRFLFSPNNLLFNLILWGCIIVLILIVLIALFIYLKVKGKNKRK